MTGFAGRTLSQIAHHILWYAKDIDKVKYHQLFRDKQAGDEGAAKYKPASSYGALPGGMIDGSKLITVDQLTSQGASATAQEFSFKGREWSPPPGLHWKTTVSGLSRLAEADRVVIEGASIRFVRFLDDFSVFPISNIWNDIGGIQNRSEGKQYVVQTAPTAIYRCMLMTTDPGELVFDPTCGSGTTAQVAEQWGRRWITADTSRVAVAIARQRLLTSKFDYLKLKDDSKGVNGGFRYKIVSHIALKTIAQNQNLDPIFAKYGAMLEAALANANAALMTVSDMVRSDLRTKLALKQKQEGKKSLTDADRHRWELPAKGTGWQQWEVPFDTDPDYPAELKRAVEQYRAAWRAKMDAVNACIAANADHEELVDQPEVDRKITRVSGPFTVEAVLPPEMSLGDIIEVNTAHFAGGPDELEDTFLIREVQMGESTQNLEAYLSKMVDLLRMDGVRFPDNKEKKFTRLSAIYATGSCAGIHAEGRWVNAGEIDDDSEGEATVGVVFGPRYGPITAKMIEQVIRPAARRYDDLVFAGFSFDGPAQAAIDEGHPKMRIHIAHIRPDVNPGMNGLLKEQPGSQLFTVFGRPRTNLKGPDRDAMYTVEMEGVDVYDPVTNNVVDTGAAKVAAWFVDSDYDGRTFCITQAFLPDRTAWAKLSKALDGVIDPERFELFSGTISLPFPTGNHKCVVVKVIDPRGNEVVRVHALEGNRG